MTIEFCIFELVHIPKFNLKLSFVFLDQISPKGIIPVKNGKSEHDHWILHIRISTYPKI